MSLARLWRNQDRVQQARELLAPVNGWFTEDFDKAKGVLFKQQIHQAILIQIRFAISRWPTTTCAVRS